MKVKIILTDDDGITYTGEVNLNQTNVTTTIKPKKKIDKNKNYRGIFGGIRFLIDGGFLNSPKSVQQIILELKKEGYYGKSASIDKLLRVDLTNKKKVLTRIKEGKVWLYVIRK